MRRVALALALSGCSSVLGIDDFKLGDAGPGGGDAMTDAMPPFCVGPTGWRVCLPTPPSGPRDLSGGDIETDIATLCLSAQPAAWKDVQPNNMRQPDACFVVATSITISGRLGGTGSRPLVLVAADTIAIMSAGAVDVATHPTGQGAGATPSCPGTGAGFNAANNQGAGGGAGGTFMTMGGSGGTSSSGVQGGAAIQPFTPPQILTAGCAGALGGMSGTTNGGQPGLGGGAVYLVAGNRIIVDGYINASGGAGRAGGPLTGGGGGGAGGMIVLHAPMITGSGILVANGGGGGGGGGSNNQLGTAGMEPDPTLPTRGALGGDGLGRGGNGFAEGSPATNGNNGTPTTAAGGGGGGGGGGYIRANMRPGNAVASPAITIVP